MTTSILLTILIILAIVNIVLTFTKKVTFNNEELKEKLIKIDSDLSRIDPLIREEFGRTREENQKGNKENRKSWQIH